MELSKTEEKAVLAVFESCGFAEITEAKILSALSGTSSRALTADRQTDSSASRCSSPM